MNFQMMVGVRAMTVHCHDQELLETLRLYYRPALLENHRSTSLKIEILPGGRIQFSDGESTQSWEGDAPARLFETALLELLFRLHAGFCILHAACIEFSERPVLFVAPSGFGKSSLTRAGMQAGGAYVSDDVLFLRPNTIAGFARSIRFKEVSRTARPLPAYLHDTTLNGYGLRGSKDDWTPIWWNGGAVARELRPKLGAVVVRVSRGEDSIRRLSEVERLVTLHEAAIVRAGEYDGSLGPGPGYELSWSDPTSAFNLLVATLRSDRVL